jgi:PAS domain S-box-containing protein
VSTRRVRLGRGPAELRDDLAALGAVVDPQAVVWVGEEVPPVDVVGVVLVGDEAAAGQAVRDGAVDALVWPAERPRLGRCLLDAWRRAEERDALVAYRGAYRHSPVWMELTDATTTLLDVSAGFERATGYRREEVLGKTPAELFRAGTHSPAFYDEVHRGILAGGWRGDLIGRRRDGSLAVLEVDIGATVHGDRFIASHAAKREVGATDASGLRAWVEGFVAAPWLLVRRDDGIVLDCGGADEVFQRSRASLIGASVVSLGLPAPSPGPHPDLWLGGRAREVRYVERRVGDVSLALVALIDVTERKEETEKLDALAHQLAQARDEALAADRAKSAFLAAMSHDLRTPLNAILGYAEMIDEEAADPQVRSDLARILAAGRHLLRLVDDVLDLARVEAGALPIHREPFDADALLTELADGVRLRAQRRGIQLVLALPGGAITSDPDRVRQIVGNLLGNAIKYAVPGRVTLGCDGRVFFVEDEGPGLSAEQAHRVFLPFQRFHDDVDGAGLGLAVSRRLAEALGGSLTVRSGGAGSRFELTLPG